MTIKRVAQNPLLLDDLLPNIAKNPIGQSIKNIIENGLGLRYLANGYSQLDTGGMPDRFVREAFKALKIDYQIPSGNVNNIPETGPTIVVANHPYGGVDGMAMIDLLLKRRSDIRVMANGILKRIPELSDIIIDVNPYGHNEAKKQNITAMRECLRWLDKGGLIFMFPAGDVSSIKLPKLSITDDKWDTSLARLAVKTSAAVVPVHINGRNSAGFYMAGALHPRLKTLLLPRQIMNKRGHNLQISIGKPIEASKLSKLGGMQKIVDMLKSRTYLLAEANKNDKAKDTGELDIIKPIAKAILALEIEQLPEKQKMTENGDMQVFYATAKQIPWLMQEIGRLREITFRESGEGTGRETDIDVFDRHYIQLFIWNRKTSEVVGGYRLGLTDEIVARYNIEGLYSFTLFKFRKSFLDKMPHAIELGRSFVRPEYQRSFTPLLLLWKGIARFVYHHPKYCILFGPVSISNDYCGTSQQLLIKFLRHNLFAARHLRLVKPRNPYRYKEVNNLNISTLNEMSIDELSALISTIEEDEKGVPVLIRQYLKLGGEMLGFNVDPDFSDCVDGLIRVDLRRTNEKVLAKYMGTDNSRDYLTYHQQIFQKTG